MQQEHPTDRQMWVDLGSSAELAVAVMTDGEPIKHHGTEVELLLPVTMTTDVYLSVHYQHIYNT